MNDNPSLIHLRSNVNQKPNLYDAGQRQRKNSHPYRKFQTGTTTTFSGYTNISNHTNKINNNNNHPKPKQQHDNNDNNNKKSFNSKEIPSLMSFDLFQEPPRKNRRKIQHLEQYKQRALLQHNSINGHQENNNNHTYNMDIKQYRRTSAKQFKGLILSDSMCKYVRPEKVSSNNIQVKISFESGCDCSKMLQFLEQQKTNQSNIFEADFLLFSLCTNDVANLGPTRTIENCRFLIERVKVLFPQLKLIGWLALSPRSKPSRLFNSTVIDQVYRDFNQHLHKLSQEMNFEMINANLQHQHMHYDGLHPSLQSGRDLIEKTIYNWFMKRTDHYHTNDNNQHYNYNTTKNNNIHHNHNNRNFTDKINNSNNNKNNNNNHRITTHHNSSNTTTIDSSRHRYNYPITTANNNEFHNNNNNTYRLNRLNRLNHLNRQIYTLNEEQHSNSIPSKSLIPHYPHFLRHKDEFFRKVTIPAELEQKKEDIFLLSNIHFQTEYFQLEAKKWEVYTIAASNKKTVERREPMEIIIEENEELPIPRPSPAGLVRHPAPLDFSDYPELFDEWLPSPKPGDKRKLGQRGDNPPTPPSPRPPPPPIIPRKTLPPRDPNLPLTGGSLPTSPLPDKVNNEQRLRQCSFNALHPSNRSDENEQIESPRAIADIINAPSMIISPIQNSTPNIQKNSPSAIPKGNKNDVAANKTYSFPIIPIECRYFFKHLRQRCTFEAIRTHQCFLQNRYETLSNERETMLHTLFDRQTWTKVVDFTKQNLERTLENKKKDDERRLDNLRLDQVREEGILEINRIASLTEQQYIGKLQDKFKRTLDLKLQYDKLEKRFVENMPPPSLNTLDRIELHAKELSSDNNQLKSLRERWKNVLRKTKLDLTTIMREAKIVEIEQARREYQDLLNRLPEHLKQAYNAIAQVIETRHNQFAKKKLNFLAKRACATSEN